MIYIANLQIADIYFGYMRKIHLLYSIRVLTCTILLSSSNTSVSPDNHEQANASSPRLSLALLFACAYSARGEGKTEVCAASWLAVSQFVLGSQRGTRRAVLRKLIRRLKWLN